MNEVKTKPYYYYRLYPCGSETIELRFKFNSKKALNSFHRYLGRNENYFGDKMFYEIPVYTDLVKMYSDIRYYLRKHYESEEICIFNEEKSQYEVISWEKPLILSGVELMKIYSGEQ